MFASEEKRIVVSLQETQIQVIVLYDRSYLGHWWYPIAWMCKCPQSSSAYGVSISSLVRREIFYPVSAVSAVTEEWAELVEGTHTGSLLLVYEDATVDMKCLKGHCGPWSLVKQLVRLVIEGDHEVCGTYMRICLTPLHSGKWSLQTPGQVVNHFITSLQF